MQKVLYFKNTTEKYCIFKTQEKKMNFSNTK